MSRKALYILLVAMMLVGCDIRPKEHFIQAPIPVQVHTATLTTAVSSRAYVGDIEESGRVPLALPIGGRVIAVHCHMGQQVKAGQVLVETDTTKAYELYRSATAALHQAEDGCQRAQLVYDEGGITDQKMVEINTQLTQARALAKVAQQGLEDCRLVAPVDGTIGQCNVHVGQQALPNATLVTILDMNGYNVVFSVPEDEVAQIKIGDKGWAEIAAIDAQYVPIHIVEKCPVASRVARTYEVKACMEHVPQQLMPNMIAKVKLCSQQNRGYWIPRSAVTLYQNGTSLWIANDSTAVRQSVVVGENMADSLLITEGLQEGSQVIVAGIQKLWQGARITY
ncbi:MAG: efflux RND transporter periplasmic adaptor subunit [Paludibacteraceae bacterium]|nr:efflux RND transporter periplasmic adaptor subunit [Paludibacteraceae bacterium]